jgi:hypothetical protein
MRKPEYGDGIERECGVEMREAVWLFVKGIVLRRLLGLIGDNASYSR